MSLSQPNRLSCWGISLRKPLWLLWTLRTGYSPNQGLAGTVKICLFRMRQAKKFANAQSASAREKTKKPAIINAVKNPTLTPLNAGFFSCQRPFKIFFKIQNLQTNRQRRRDTAQKASLAYGSKLASWHLLTGFRIAAKAIMFQQGAGVLVVYPFVGVVKADIARRIIYRRKCRAAACARHQQTYGQRYQ